MGIYSKIEWADATFDLITGCKHGCPYCYASAMAKRFGGDVRENLTHTDKFEIKDGVYYLRDPFIGESGKQIYYPFGFEPTVHYYRMQTGSTYRRIMQGFGKKIFVGAMSDMFGDWVPDSVIREVFNFVGQYPRNNYIFLTKNPQRYQEIQHAGWLPYMDNFWYGTTVTGQVDSIRMHFLPENPIYPVYHRFVSYEPIVGPINDGERINDIENVEWMIMGAMTGRNCKIVYPEPEWIWDAVRIAKQHRIPVYMKDSLIPTVGEDHMLREYPEALTQVRRSPIMQRIKEDRCMECGKTFDKKQMVSISGRRSMRGYSTKSIGYVCWDCLRKFCEEHGIDYDEIESGIGRDV